MTDSAAPAQISFDDFLKVDVRVGTIVAVNFARGAVRGGDGPRDGWRRTCIEAAKQSAQAWIPNLSVANSLSAALEAIPDAAIRLVAEPAATSATIADVITQSTGSNPIVSVVGPEGGLTDDERALLARAGFAAVNLGPAILRIETACVALAVRVQTALESVEKP